MAIGVIHPGSGNLTSLCDAFDRLERPYRVCQNPDDLNGIEILVLPGQGRFGPTVSYLRQNGWAAMLRQWLGEDRPFLGICVGMQVLFEASEEDPAVPGLGLFPGRLKRLDARPLPMMGWAEVNWQQPGWPPGMAYFVNSYVLPDSPFCLATTAHGGGFCSAIRRGRCLAFQFHPEKSGPWGKEVLAPCLA